MSFLSSKSAPTGSKPTSSLAAMSAPSPTPSTASSTSKRKRPPPNAAIFSQPANTGSGQQLMTQVHYALEHLKEKDRALSFDDIIGYLSIKGDITKQLLYIFKSHARIEYDPAGFNGRGSFRYKPLLNIRSADQLKGYLQRQKSSQGISVRDLRDGWTDAIAAIDALERAGELLVTRNKKDNLPRTVWQNDPTLAQKIEEDFKTEWHKIPLPPNQDDLRKKLEQAGLKPTSAPPVNTGPKKSKEKKKRTVKRGGRQTNTHMVGVLKDYSHKRK